MEDLDSLYSSFEEIERLKIVARDRRMKKAGMRCRVTAWVHLDGAGEDYSVHWYFADTPTTRQIAKRLLRGGFRYHARFHNRALCRSGRADGQVSIAPTSRRRRGGIDRSCPCSVVFLILPGDPAKSRDSSGDSGRDATLPIPTSLHGIACYLSSRRGSGGSSSLDERRLLVSSSVTFPFRPNPAVALIHGTLNQPPVRSSGKSVPPEGRPQFSACPVAALASPRTMADSVACRKAP